MELTLIPHKSCPTCGADAVAESCRHRHCNGQGFEIRDFACGARIAWSPNNERLEFPFPCSKSAKEIQKKEKRKVAVASLLQFVATLDTDQYFKDTIIDYVRIYQSK